MKRRDEDDDGICDVMCHTPSLLKLKRVREADCRDESLTIWKGNDGIRRVSPRVSLLSVHLSVTLIVLLFSLFLPPS